MDSSNSDTSSIISSVDSSSEQEVNSKKKSSSKGNEVKVEKIISNYNKLKKESFKNTEKEDAVIETKQTKKKAPKTEKPYEEEKIERKVCTELYWESLRFINYLFVYKIH